MCCSRSGYFPGTGARGARCTSAAGPRARRSTACGRRIVPAAGRRVTSMAMTTVAPTRDLTAARADLAEHGYCLVEGLLSAERVAQLRTRIIGLAEQERGAGTDYVYEDGANQRVWTLLNKGDCFVELALDPAALDLIRPLLGSDFLLSNIDANVAGPGGKPMFLHADQSFVPPPWPPYPLVAKIMWM